MLESNEYISSCDGIEISAYPVVMEEEKMCGYYFCIENNSNQKIQLIGKDWSITDDRGHIFNDSSDGFKGELPELDPGECFEYSDVIPMGSSEIVFYGVCKVKNESGIREVKMPTLMFDRAIKKAVFN